MHLLSRLPCYFWPLLVTLLLGTVARADMDPFDSFEEFKPQANNYEAYEVAFGEFSEAEPVAIDNPGEANYRQGLASYLGLDGLPVDKELAYRSFKQSAKDGHVGGMHALASIYLEGLGKRSSHYKAAGFWFRKAALRGHAQSQAALSCLYSEGKGIDKNSTLAFYWMQQAAQQGLPEAQYYTGYFFDKGEGVKQDLEKALQWYLKAAKQGYLTAELNAGVMFLKGEGAQVDYQSARHWFKQAMVGGHHAAPHYLGYMHLHGLGGAVKLDRAVMLYEKAARAGFEPAQITLAEIHLKAADKKYQDFGKSFKWAFAAAKKNNTDAQWLLSFIFSAGKGVAQDIKEGYAWALMSEVQGNARAGTFRQKLEKQMDKKKRMEARKRARVLWKKVVGSAVA